MLNLLVQPLMNVALKETTKQGLKIGTKVGMTILTSAGSVIVQGLVSKKQEEKLIAQAEQIAKDNGGQLPEEDRVKLNRELVKRRAIVAGVTSGAAALINGVGSFGICKGIDASNVSTTNKI